MEFELLGSPNAEDEAPGKEEDPLGNSDSDELPAGKDAELLAISEAEEELPNRTDAELAEAELDSTPDDCRALEDGTPDDGTPDDGTPDDDNPEDGRPEDGRGREDGAIPVDPGTLDTADAEEEAGNDRLGSPLELPNALDPIGMLRLGSPLETGGREPPLPLELGFALSLERFGKLEDCESDGMTTLELTRALLLDAPGKLEEPAGGSDSDGRRDEENGGIVPVPPGNELLPGTVTIRLDHDGRSELDDPAGTDTVMLLPGRLPKLLEDAGTTPELTPPLGMGALELEDCSGRTELPDTGRALLPGRTLERGGTLAEPEG